jgi:hypothetical protein
MNSTNLKAAHYEIFSTREHIPNLLNSLHQDNSISQPVCCHNDYIIELHGIPHHTLDIRKQVDWNGTTNAKCTKIGHLKVTIKVRGKDTPPIFNEYIACFEHIQFTWI